VALRRTKGTAVKISVITPTYNWQQNLPYLYRHFQRQTHADKELLLLDDSPRPSEFFANLGDPQVRYFHSPQRISIGAKRNLLVERAAGEVIAHFDHDDYYAPSYLERMVAYLENADLVTLDGWFAYDTPSRSLFYWQTSEVSALHYALAPEGLRALDLRGLAAKDDWVRRNVYGYGFSYVYRKNLGAAARFPDTQAHDEDYSFAATLLRGSSRLLTVNDREGLLLHLTHAGGMSTIFPNYRLPHFLLRQLFGADAVRYLAEVFAIPDL
jgi:glycosyltransferase involved in cell wall biosynthesis